MPALSKAKNKRRLFLNLQIPVDNAGKRALFSLDAAKAFDSVALSYLWEVLEWEKRLFSGGTVC